MIADYVKQHGIIAIGLKNSIVGIIQLALNNAGHVLIIDSDFGKLTETAVKQFQAAHDLTPVGYVGPKTAAALDDIQAKAQIDPKPSPAFEYTSILKIAPHLAVMRAITGTKEVPGSKSSPIIMSWRSVIADKFPEMRDYCMTYTGDEIPWCGYAMAFCFAKAGLRPQFGKEAVDKFMWAASWSEVSESLVRIPDKNIFPGCVLTFTRNGGGHVSMCERVNSDGSFYIRGGNQSDMVNVVQKSRAQFTAATWPRSLPIPAKDAIKGIITNAVPTGSEV